MEHNTGDNVARELGILANRLGDALRIDGRHVTTAESCTGGLIAAAITDVAGSSDWFAQGVVTYSNAAKQQLLGVDASLFDAHGAVSEACVLAMATGALTRSGADVAISVSGIAGPDGAVAGKPVGTVWIAWAMKQTAKEAGKVSSNENCITAEACVFHFSGDRHRVRQLAVLEALRGTISRLDHAELKRP